MKTDPFVMLGDNLIKMGGKIVSNANISKLLYYTTKDPLNQPELEEPDILLDHNIRFVPQIPLKDEFKGSFIILTMDTFDADDLNSRVKDVAITITTLCPIDEWTTNSGIRPILILSELDKMFNGLRLSGIGQLHLVGGELVVPTDWCAGYSAIFTNKEFNG